MQTKIKLQTRIENCRVAVLSKNMLEVADLTDFFQRKGETAVLVLRDPAVAARLIGCKHFRPELILYAYDDSTDGAHACWDALRTRGISTIRIGNGLGPGQCVLANEVIRPFTTGDIEDALSRLAAP